MPKNSRLRRPRFILTDTNHPINKNNAVSLLAVFVSIMFDLASYYFVGSLIFLVQSFFETLQYCDEGRKFNRVIQSYSHTDIQSFMV